MATRTSIMHQQFPAAPLPECISKQQISQGPMTDAANIAPLASIVTALLLPPPQPILPTTTTNVYVFLAFFDRGLPRQHVGLFFVDQPQPPRSIRLLHINDDPVDEWSLAHTSFDLVSQGPSYGLTGCVRIGEALDDSVTASDLQEWVEAECGPERRPEDAVYSGKWDCLAWVVRTVKHLAEGEMVSVRGSAGKGEFNAETLAFVATAKGSALQIGQHSEIEWTDDGIPWMDL